MSSATATDNRGRTNLPSGKKRSYGRGKKRQRQFQGNKDSDVPAARRPTSSASSKKLQSVTTEASETDIQMIDVSIVYPELEKVVSCVKCHGKVRFSQSGVHGIGFYLNVSCTNCNADSNIPSSRVVGTRNNAFEINRRSVIAARALGHGHAGLSTFCGIMDLPQPVVHSAFDKIVNQLSDVCEAVALDSMRTAVKEEVAMTPQDNEGLIVSGDGSWRKRGFSSLQGLSSIIGNNTGKVIDTSIKNSFCKACTKWEGKEETAGYEEWFEEHEPHCTSNHEGSAGKMEVNGVVEMFQRSQQKYGVKYKYYIGDGDSKVFATLSTLKPYGDDVIVEKKECVGHVQKRMGTRLRNLKKTSGSKTLADGKTIGGRGRLTANVIDQLTVYYGNAIRAHSESVDKMSNAIWATYYHKLSTDQDPQHHLCPEGANSWCKWQKAKAAGQHTAFIHKSSIPSAVMNAIKPIYKDLTNRELLTKCMGGYTQNSNESFNNSVWKLVPKTSFSGLSVLKIGVNMAVTNFNDGLSGYLKIMDKFDVQPGTAATEWAATTVERRLFHAERKTLASTQESRRTRRNIRHQLQEESYGAGAH